MKIFELIFSFLKKSRFFKSRNVGFLSFCRISVLNEDARVHNFVWLYKTNIGQMSYVANFTRISNCTIGKFSSIGPNVKIGLGIHPTTWVSTHPAFFSKGKQALNTFVSDTRVVESNHVDIGNDVWIGQSAILMDGITVADGAIIGAGAVVTKDVPPYAVVGGVPAKVLKYRFERDDIEFLLRLKWWDKDYQWLSDHVDHFSDIALIRNAVSNC